MKKSSWQIFQAAFNKLKEESPRFSVRSLALKLDVSHSYVSKVLSGKIQISEDRIDDFCRILKIDEIERLQIYRIISKEILSRKLGLDLPPTPREPGEKDQDVDFGQYEKFDHSGFWLLQNPHRLAVLDLVTCCNFREDPIWIGKRLGISASFAVETIKCLEEFKLVMRDDQGRLRKQQLKIRFPTAKTHPTVREYHKSQLEKGLLQLKSKHSESDFSKRLISGVSFAANPERLEKAKQVLNEAIYKAAEILADGDDCTEIYQTNLQLFPLTSN